MTRIVAIGECMVEMAPVATEGQYRLGYAGDTLNTAWYLRRLLGAIDQIDYFTAVGSDAVGYIAPDGCVAVVHGCGGHGERGELGVGGEAVPVRVLQDGGLR